MQIDKAVKLTLSLILGAGLLLVAFKARADVFTLNNGGQVRGDLVSDDGETLVIKNEAGVSLSVEHSQLKSRVLQSATELEYEKIAPHYADTPEAQWELAQWCREHGLVKQRQTHLERIIQLDPDHLEARRALGYSQVEGRWVRQDQLMEERGYVRYKGQWRLPQDVEIMERKRKDELAETEWYSKLKRYRTALNDANKADAAMASIVAITDPYAVPALAANLNTEQTRSIKLLYIRALASVHNGSALGVLVSRSLDDPDEEVRLSCLDQLIISKPPEATAMYAKELRSKDNVRVNRAAVGLARMKDPAAIGPLIDALITTHKFKIVQGDPGQTTTTFGSGGPGNSGGGMSVGGGPKIISQKMMNREVLDALVVLAGGTNFNFDIKAWKTWYASQKKPQSLDARRG